MADLFTELAGLRAFIVYRVEAKPSGALDKIPIALATRQPCDAQNPDSWMTPEHAQSWAAHLGAGYGVGLVISENIVLPNGSRLACLDIDRCRDGERWAAHAHHFCGLFPGAYVEVSVSGNGLHVLVTYRGERPEHGVKNSTYRCELYTRRRFIALTGTNAKGSILTDHTSALNALAAQYFPPRDETEHHDALTDAPVPEWSGPADDDQLLALGMRMKSPKAVFGGKATFADLFTGNVDVLARAFPPSKNTVWDESAADLAFANWLAWLTGNHGVRMERIMQRSALKRSKWDRESYLIGTINRACAGCKQWYSASRNTTEPTATEQDSRAAILLRGGDFHSYTRQAEELIADEIYMLGNKLVRLGNASEISDAQLKDNAGTKREAAQAVIIPASAAWMRRALMHKAQFWKYDKRAKDWEPQDCPKEIPENICAQESWTAFRPLIAISPVPILRPDMSLWTQPGYDAATGIFHSPTLTMPDTPAAPTRENALQALARLREPFTEFPFATPDCESVFLAHVITAVLRAAFGTSPIFVYTSPTVATGKTLLGSMANIIAHGVAPAQSPYSEGEELRKVLFSSLLAGDAALTLDNVPNGHKVRAPVLCGFATAAIYSDRILGQSETRKAPNRCTVVLTGNNIVPAADMARRSLVCRLDANAESARGRNFRISDLRGYVREHRAQLIVDVITIVRAYAFAGRPNVARPLESFEQWSQLVRAPLVWLGMSDPVESQVTETDDELAPLQGAFTAIASATQGQGCKFTTAQLAGILQHGLRESLIEAGCDEPNNAQKLGYWLRAQKDRVAGGWKLTSQRLVHGGASCWQLLQKA